MPIHKEPIMPRLTLEQAWEDWEETNKLLAEMRVKLGEMAQKKTRELQKTYNQNQDLVVAWPERLAELEKQKKEVLEKYGKGAAVRVRDFASSESDQGTSGKKR